MIVAPAAVNLGQDRVPEELELSRLAEEIGLTDGQFCQQVVQEVVVGFEPAAICRHVIVHPRPGHGAGDHQVDARTPIGSEGQPGPGPDPGSQLIVGMPGRGHERSLVASSHERGPNVDAWGLDRRHTARIPGRWLGWVRSVNFARPFLGLQEGCPQNLAGFADSWVRSACFRIRWVLAQPILGFVRRVFESGWCPLKRFLGSFVVFSNPVGGCSTVPAPAVRGVGAHSHLGRL
jgi:hypothetical protein